MDLKQGELAKHIGKTSIRMEHEPPLPEQYVQLRLRSGMGTKDLERSRIALAHSVFVVAIYDEDMLVGFGRVVGDQGITFVVSDIMVHPEYRRLGFAEWIMQEIDGFFAEYAYDDSFILLIANKPADLLYTKHRFEYLSPDRCGMLRNQKK